MRRVRPAYLSQVADSELRRNEDPELSAGQDHNAPAPTDGSAGGFWRPHARQPIGVLVVIATAGLVASLLWSELSNGAPDPVAAVPSFSDRSPEPSPEPAGTATAEPVVATGAPIRTLLPTDDPSATIGPTVAGAPSAEPIVLVGMGPPIHVPVLTYHVIAPWNVARSYSTVDLNVTPQRLGAHLQALRDEGWRTITAHALADALEKGLLPPPRTFVITIDDGHDDGYLYGLPIIARYGFVATYYVVPGRLGMDSYLSWDQVRALRDAGMEIGNHTFDHVALTTLASGEAFNQVMAAQIAFLQELGSLPTTFAYPFGKFDSLAAAAVQAARLRLAFTTQGGKTETWATRFTLPRVHVGGALTAPELLKIVASFR